MAISEQSIITKKVQTVSSVNKKAIGVAKYFKSTQSQPSDF